jgi:hypothetical protein
MSVLVAGEGASPADADGRRRNPWRRRARGNSGGGRAEEGAEAGTDAGPDDARTPRAGHGRPARERRSGGGASPTETRKDRRD